MKRYKQSCVGTEEKGKYEDWPVRLIDDERVKKEDHHKNIKESISEEMSGIWKTRKAEFKNVGNYRVSAVA